MTNERKTSLQNWSAIAMLTAGTLMAFLSLLLPPTGEIDNGALWYTGQCFLYAGGIFGIGTYTKNRFTSIERRLKLSGNEDDAESA